MPICPICNENITLTMCHCCGYDNSINYESYGSLTPLAVKQMSLVGYKKRWIKKTKNIFRCTVCSGISFSFATDSLKLTCRNCGTVCECKEIKALQKTNAVNQKEIEELQQNTLSMESVKKELENRLQFSEKALDDANKKRGDLSHRIGELIRENQTLRKEIITQRVQAKHEESLNKQSIKNSSLKSLNIQFGTEHVLLRYKDGTVDAIGSNYDGRCNTASWKNITSIAAGACHSCGLLSDGTVIAKGRNEDGQCDVELWHNMIAIAAGYYHTLGLSRDGVVRASGRNTSLQCNVNSWNNIVAVAAGKNHSLGLRKDGSVVSVGQNSMGQCNVSSWNSIKQIACGANHSVGLCTNGHVVATGNNKFQQCEVGEWRNIVSVVAGVRYIAGLRSNGTVVIAGVVSMSIAVENWNNIVAIYAAEYGIAGLQKNGRIVCAGTIIEEKQLRDMMIAQQNNHKETVQANASVQYTKTDKATDSNLPSNASDPNKKGWLKKIFG